MRRHNPLPYSPHLAFQVARPFTHNGQEMKRGDAFDTTGLTEHKLRQYFDARLISPTGFAADQKPAFFDAGVGVADRLAAERLAEEGGEDDDAADDAIANDSTPQHDGTDDARAAAASEPAAPVQAKPSRAPRKRSVRRAAA